MNSLRRHIQTQHKIKQTTENSIHSIHSNALYRQALKYGTHYLSKVKCPNLYTFKKQEHDAYKFCQYPMNLRYSSYIQLSGNHPYFLPLFLYLHKLTCVAVTQIHGLMFHVFMMFVCLIIRQIFFRFFSVKSLCARTLESLCIIPLNHVNSSPFRGNLLANKLLYLNLNYLSLSLYFYLFLFLYLSLFFLSLFSFFLSLSHFLFSPGP